MKKNRFAVVFACLCTAFLLFSCSKKESTVSTAAKDTSQKSFKVGLVTDTGGIDDRSFNQGTWEGIQEFVKEYKAKGAAEGIDITDRYIQSDNDANYVPNLSQFAEDGYNLVVAPGFLFNSPLSDVSSQFPQTKFLIMDSVVKDRPNVVSALFAQNEGSFLVGVAAAMTAQSAGKKSVGIILGMDFDTMRWFEAGYEAGVHAVDPKMQVRVEILNSFSDAQKGQTIAAKMYDSGINVIYQVAGGAGNGVIKEAKDRRLNGQKVWVIGVDRNQYADGIYDQKGDSVILTSMLKRVNVAALKVCVATLENKFPGGKTLNFTLKDNGVGIPDENPNLSPEILKKIDYFKQQIIDGKIIVPLIPARTQNK